MASGAAGRKKHRLEVPQEKRAEAAARLWGARAYDRGYFAGVRRFEDFAAGAPNVAVGKLQLIGRGRYRVNRSLSDYQRILLPKGKSIRSIVQRKIAGKKGRTRVLEVGYGQLRFLAELAEEFPELRLSGLAVSKPLSGKNVKRLMEKTLEEYRETHPGARNWSQLPAKLKAKLRKIELESTRFGKRLESGKLDIRTGMAETYGWGRKKFDLIFSAFALPFAINPKQALQNTLSHLAGGGEAFIVVKEWKTVEQESAGWLEEQGIKWDMIPTNSLYPVYHFTKA